MKKKISFSTQGQRADIGHITIYRMLPNRYADGVGPFVFLDHFGPTRHAVNEPIQKNGNGAHPRRGIATLTYILNGEEEHFDSKGNYGKINSGGVQWMKSGIQFIQPFPDFCTLEFGNRVLNSHRSVSLFCLRIYF